MAYAQGFNPRWGPDNGWGSHGAVPAGYGVSAMPGLVNSAATLAGVSMMGGGVPGGGYPYGYGCDILPGIQPAATSYGAGAGFPPGATGGVVTAAPVMTPNGVAMLHTHIQPANPFAPSPRPVITPAGRPPAPFPIIDPDFPAAQMTNSTGGVGCEPGYNMWFHPEHTKIIALKTGATPPWQLPPGANIPFTASHVPCNTKIGDLMKGFGATNANPQLNIITEVVASGDSRWYRGMQFCSEVVADMAKTVKEVGWDSSRTGQPGEGPVVYVYVTKD